MDIRLKKFAIRLSAIDHILTSTQNFWKELERVTMIVLAGEVLALIMRPNPALQRIAARWRIRLKPKGHV